MATATPIAAVAVRKVTRRVATISLQSFLPPDSFITKHVNQNEFSRHRIAPSKTTKGVRNFTSMPPTSSWHGTWGVEVISVLKKYVYP